MTDNWVCLQLCRDSAVIDANVSFSRVLEIFVRCNQEEVHIPLYSWLLILDVASSNSLNDRCTSIYQPCLIRAISATCRWNSMSFVKQLWRLLTCAPLKRSRIPSPRPLTILSTACCQMASKSSNKLDACIKASTCKSLEKLI